MYTYKHRYNSYSYNRFNVYSYKYRHNRYRYTLNRYNRYLFISTDRYNVTTH